MCSTMYRLVLIASCVALALGLPQPRGIPRLDGRIVNGQPAEIEDFPYQISLQMNGYHICGGSIISKRFVVTAAHCTDGAYVRFLSVRAGSSIVEDGGVVINVAKIHQNPYFNSRLDYDVSVLELEEDIEFGSAIQPIALASNEPEVDTDVVCTGWGALYTNGPSPTQLQKVTVQVLDREDCRDEYGSSKITENMICAAAPNKDACQGDSGGPLAANGVLVGIVSWGYNCADPDYAGVYTNVAAVSDYIKENSQ